MPAPSNVSLQTLKIAALLVLATASSLAFAQPTATDTPVTTLADEPVGEQLSPEESDKRARALFQQGRAAFEEGHYRDAWDYFRRAYLLSKRPELLYNVGQSADRMRMDREALEAFRLYLKRLPGAPNRREVENRIRALEEHPSVPGGSGAQPAQAAAGGSGAATPSATPSGATLGGSNEQKPEQPGGIFGGSEPSPPPPPRDNGQPRRTGFYLRLGLGLGFISDSVHGGGVDTTISSGTICPHVLAGYEVAGGLVIGGGLLFDWSLAPGLHSGSGHVVDIDAANLGMLAAFIDYYLAPRTDGWHIMGGLGVGSFALSDASGAVNHNAGGAELIGGGGYEWPLDREWALGVLGRLVIARMSAGSAGHTIFAPSIAASATWF